MNITQVYYVLAVAKCRSFSAAAQELFVSQPALSKQIRSLEIELGYDLFSRASQGVTLTREGERFCRYGQQAVDSWEYFQRQVDYKDKSVTRRLRIGLGSRVYSNGLFEDVVRFFENHPELEVTFVEEAGKDFLAELSEGRLDLVLDRLPSREVFLGQDSNVMTYDLISEQQCILMARSDPRSKLESISFKDLQGCAMISGLENSMEDKQLKADCRRYDITLSRVYRCNSMDTIMQLVRKGKGVVSGPQSFSDYYDVAAVRLKPEEEVALCFICLRKNAGRQHIQIFRRYMQEVCREKQGSKFSAMYP